MRAGVGPSARGWLPNGHADELTIAPSPTSLERAGIARFSEQSFSVDAVQTFKPAPATDQLIANTLGVEKLDMCPIACRLWDRIGAQAAGCRGALVLRPHNDVLPAARAACHSPCRTSRFASASSRSIRCCIWSSSDWEASVRSVTPRTPSRAVSHARSSLQRLHPANPLFAHPIQAGGRSLGRRTGFVGVISCALALPPRE